jgi:hypothetical protein
MGIVFNGGVINSGGTPAAITGVIANIPAATSVAEGTIYISTDTQEIFTAQAGSWINVSGGGGGSQNLDQVLAVGNIGINKDILLYNTTPTPTQYAQIKNNISENLINLGATDSGKNFITSINQDFFGGGSEIEQSISTIPTLYPLTSLRYSGNTGGKNLFIVAAQNGLTDFRRFVVNASYSDGNTVEITESNNSGDVFSVKSEADVSIPDAYIRAQFQNLNIPSQQYISVHLDRIETYNSVNSTFINYIYPSFNAAGSIATSTPEFNGIMANVNERIVASGISLSGGNFDCDRYGAYQVKTGSNTNDFDLTNFAQNGVDGQFVTIMAEDTPIQCINTAGQIFGTANINSKGLFKLMKFGSDIYSSHL